MTDKSKLLTTVARGSVIAFAGIIIGKCINFSIHLLLAKNMTVNDYGVFSLAYSIFIILTNIALLGIPTAVLRFCSSFSAIKNDSKVKGTIITGYLIVFLNSIFFVLIVLAFGETFFNYFFHSPQLNKTITAFVVLIPLFTFNRLTHITMRAFKFILVHIAIKEVILQILFFAGIASLFWLGFSLPNVAKAYIFATVASFLICIAALKILVIKPLILFSDITCEVKNFLRFSLPIFAVSFSYLLLNQTSKIFLGHFVDAKNVAMFNVAMNFSVFIVIFLNCVETIFAPIISELYTQKKIEEMHYMFQTSTRWVFTFCVPVLAVCFLFSENLMALFGENYMDGKWILVILISGYFINSITGPVAFILQMTGHQDTDFANMIPIVIFNLIACFFLIQKFGIWGAAVATSSTMMILNTVRLLEVYYFFRIQPYNIKYFKPVLALLISLFFYFLFVSFVFVPQWYFSALAVVIFYFVSLLLFGLDSDDLMLYKKIKEKMFA